MEDQTTTMTPKQQTVDRLKNSVSVVVTLGTNPSADEYASAIGLVHILRRFGKKASVISNSALPPQLTFLTPGDIVTDRLDHLRDFVIELDREKADKLRYEPSEEVVKIYITPYKQEITQADLRFSQGNYNVDTLIAIGATSREALDGALKDHGQLLHDAMVITLSAGEKLSSFGAINWQEPTASTVAEMLVSVADALQAGLLDQVTAQVLLSALVAATDRFHNHKTTPKVMTIAAQLIAAGADPQIVMSQFESTNPGSQPVASVSAPTTPAPAPTSKPDSRSLSIPHEKGKKRPANNQDKRESRKPAPAKETKQHIAPPPIPQPLPAVAPPTPAPLPPLASPAPLPPAPSLVPPANQGPAPLPSGSSDNSLAADAIDALMDNNSSMMDEFTAPAPNSQIPSIPMMQHHTTLSAPDPAPAPAPAPLPPMSAPAPLPPLAPPAPIAPAPQPAIAAPEPIAPIPSTPTEPDTSSIDAARQAVEQAMSQLPPATSAAPTPAAPQPANPSSDIFVAPDGTLQYATPPTS